MIGFAGLLTDHNLSDRQRQFANAIRTSGDHLLGIIDDILDFSKLQSGRFELSPAPFSLRPTIESALDFVAGKAAERGVELAYVMGAEVPAGLVGDEARIRQILINYLSNAVKFTAKGEIVLHVQSKPLGADGQHEFHFSVRDTGMGIPPERMDRLFVEFSQTDAAIAGRFGGTGLGLAICRKLAELHGGRVWAESRPGAGSTFHLAIPALARPDLEARALPASGSLRGLRALIVDDNATNIEILREQTESWGMRVRATLLPTEALSWLERGEEFHLVITDHDMPVIDGVELARRIRHTATGARVPIVLFSSVGGNSSVGRDTGDTFAAVLTKPIKQSELFNRISEVLQPGLPAEKEGPAPLPSTTSPLSILLAEDNAMNQTVAVYLLERIGYRADVVSDGQEAVEALERKPYDVILMDMQMPKLDGIGATRAIRARGASIRQPRIIAMTANAMRGDREACLAAGMDDYVSKPVDHKELADALAKASPSPALAPGPNEPATPREGGELDRAALEKLVRAIGGANATKLVEMFAQETPRCLAILHRAVDCRDPAALAACAHQLKSTCGTLGARNLGRLLEEVEAAGRAGAIDGCGSKLTEVERRVQSMLSELAEVEREWT